MELEIENVGGKKGLKKLKKFDDNVSSSFQGKCKDFLIKQESRTESLPSGDFELYIQEQVAPKDAEVLRRNLKAELDVFILESKRSQPATTRSENKLYKNDQICCNMLKQVLGYEPPLLHVYGFIYRKHRMKQLKEAVNVKLKLGKYSPREDFLIKRNLEEFMNKHGIDNPIPLLGIYGDHRFNNAHRCVKVDDYFWLRLAKGLDNRPLNSVYERARFLYEPSPNKGKLDKGEVKKIVELRKVRGYKWTRLGQILGRCNKNLRAINAYMEKDINRGLWTKKEERKLCRVVSEYLKSNPLSGCVRRLPWAEFSKHIPFRNATQCRQKWFSMSQWKQEQLQIHRWSKIHDMCLTYFMYLHIVQEENFVDWDAVFCAFQYSVPYLKIKGHWSKLKRMVPDHRTKDHEEIVLYVYHNFLLHYLPKLGLKISDFENWLKRGKFPQKT